MTVYIGVVGPSTVPTNALISIMNIKRREGDTTPLFYMGTKGYETRQKHINKFMESEHSHILLLDHDMIFEEDTLERLRSWGVPYVSGYYMRRRYAPMVSVWFEPWSGKWPFMPFWDTPSREKLTPIGASGWGCIYIAREVIEDTRQILKGQWEVIEDDMHVWPYDVNEVMAGREQLRPLRKSRKPVGSDVRFPFLAREAGYQLWGDANVRPKHLLDYPLSPDDFEAMPDEVRERFKAEIMEQVKAVWHE